MGTIRLMPDFISSGPTSAKHSKRQRHGLPLFVFSAFNKEILPKVQIVFIYFKLGHI